MSGWLNQPVTLHSSRVSNCTKDMTDEQCADYRQSWHYWSTADYVYAQPTIAYFMSIIGVFIIGHVVSRAILLYRRPAPPAWRRIIAAIRYLSYRGFHVKALRWTSAPVGALALVVVSVVYFLCMALIPVPYLWPRLDFGNLPPLSTRSAWMALTCLPFVFATASKANWITLVTGASYERLQMFHRWISYGFFVLVLMHVFTSIGYHVRFHDMAEQVTEKDTFKFWTGIVSLTFQTWLTVASFGSIRNLAYEFFKASHFFAVVLFVLHLFWHCNFTFTSWDYFIATAAVYVPCLAYSWIRTYVKYGFGQKAEIFIEENGFIRITIPANFDWVPGQHCFLRFRGFGMHNLSSHPFTICSLPSNLPDEVSSMTFYVRRRGGLTTKLYSHAIKYPNVSVPVFVDGPYGGIDPQRYFASDRLIIIAGGSGSGWSLALIEQFAKFRSYSSTKECVQEQQHTDDKSFSRNVSQTQHDPRRLLSLRIILATKDTATRIWFRKIVSHILSKHSTVDLNLDLVIQVYLTGEVEQHSDSPKVPVNWNRSTSSDAAEETISKNEVQDKACVRGNIANQEQRGRPQLPSIIREEATRSSQTGQSLGIYVCGPETMQNDVRNAVAKENLEIFKNPRSGGIYLHTEHFSWA